jgi:hypothetical protein
MNAPGDFAICEGQSDWSRTVGEEDAVGRCVKSALSAQRVAAAHEPEFLHNDQWGADDTPRAE